MAMEAVLGHTHDVILMQCNTNYTASLENFKYINLNVLKEYKARYPDVVLGLSDHTPGHATVLGSVALGARVIEKHFTDDVLREGPDHKFSMDYSTWTEMVNRTRELEFSLGNGVKKVEDNEKETVILQRRAIRAGCDLKVGNLITRDVLEVLRPCPSNALPPYHIDEMVGKTVTRNMVSGECITWNDVK
jgi:N-acetylneuraminate synthase